MVHLISGIKSPLHDLYNQCNLFNYFKFTVTTLKMVNILNTPNMFF